MFHQTAPSNTSHKSPKSPQHGMIPCPTQLPENCLRLAVTSRNEPSVKRLMYFGMALVTMWVSVGDPHDGYHGSGRRDQLTWGPGRPDGPADSMRTDIAKGHPIHVGVNRGTHMLETSHPVYRSWLPTNAKLWCIFPAEGRLCSSFAWDSHRRHRQFTFPLAHRRGSQSATAQF